MWLFWCCDPVSVGEGAEHPKPEEMASIDPVDLPSPSDPRLAIKLKELELELSRQHSHSCTSTQPSSKST